jgi:SAM-dependent methyltransferase
MRPFIKIVLPLAALSAIALLLHRRAGSLGRPVAGGVLIGDAAAYDRLTGWLLGSFYDGVAADIRAIATPGASVLDVGCGPGHLASRLAAMGLDVTGIDLDPVMVERAAARGAGRYLAADAASLPFEDGAFDLAVSTLSMHHWADAHAGLAELGRVVGAEGRVVVWDLGPGAPLHRHAPDPEATLHDAPLDVIESHPWRWPGPLSFVRRLEMRRARREVPSAG